MMEHDVGGSDNISNLVSGETLSFRKATIGSANAGSYTISNPTESCDGSGGASNYTLTGGNFT